MNTKNNIYYLIAFSLHRKLNFMSVGLFRSYTSTPWVMHVEELAERTPIEVFSIDHRVYLSL